MANNNNEETEKARLRRKVEFVDQFMRTHGVSSRRASDEFERRERAKTTRKKARRPAAKKTAKKAPRGRAATEVITRATLRGGLASPEVQSAVAGAGARLGARGLRKLRKSRAAKKSAKTAERRKSKIPSTRKKPPSKRGKTPRSMTPRQEILKTRRRVKHA